MNSLISENGQILKTKEEILVEIKRFYENLYKEGK